MCFSCTRDAHWKSISFGWFSFGQSLNVESFSFIPVVSSESNHLLFPADFHVSPNLFTFLIGISWKIHYEYLDQLDVQPLNISSPLEPATIGTIGNPRLQLEWLFALHRFVAHPVATICNSSFFSMATRHRWRLVFFFKICCLKGAQVVKCCKYDLCFVS